MSGSGDSNQSQRPNRSIGHQIAEGLLQSLRLLFKTLPIRSVPLTIEAIPVFFDPSFKAAPCNQVLPQPPAVAVSDDPVQHLKAQARCQTQALLLATNVQSHKLPVTIQAFCNQPPPLETTRAELHHISFEACETVQQLTLPIPPLTSQAYSALTKLSQACQSRSWPIPQLKPRGVKTLSSGPASPKVKTDAKLFGLPIRKLPLPPTRFSPQARQVFRQVLAEKSGTSPSNIQLKTIFARLQISLYSAIQQDEHGALLCLPKNEQLGMNARQSVTSSKGKLSATNAYLVIGIRLDNKAEVRAMVFESQLPNPTTVNAPEANSTPKGPGHDDK